MVTPVVNCCGTSCCVAYDINHCDKLDILFSTSFTRVQLVFIHEFERNEASVLAEKLALYYLNSRLDDEGHASLYYINQILVLVIVFGKFVMRKLHNVCLMTEPTPKICTNAHTCCAYLNITRRKRIFNTRIRPGDKKIYNTRNTQITTQVTNFTQTKSINYRNFVRSCFSFTAVWLFSRHLGFL